MTLRRPGPPPLWSRWLLAGLVAAAAIAGVVIAVDRAGTESNVSSEAAANAEVSRIEDETIAEDEQPHTATVAAGRPAIVALEQDIAADVRERISRARLTGPLSGVHCRASGSPRGARAPYSCTVDSAHITYPFLAVFDSVDRRLTWCKNDPPPVKGVGTEEVISSKCHL